MGCFLSKKDGGQRQGQGQEEDQMYQDPAGNLIQYEKRQSAQHNSAEELRFIQKHDSKYMAGGDEGYILSTIWLDAWVAFARKQRATHPGRIKNNVLVEETDHFTLRANLSPKADYRPISKPVWEFYFQKYGGGPIILFYGACKATCHLFKVRCSSAWFRRKGL